MIKNYIKYFLPLSIILFSTLTSCKKVFEEDNYIAYFGGEILNPQDKFILFMKDNEVIDTIFLDKNNRFMHKFDSLAPGLYTFKHNPEYQYIYFDKNDSLMVRVNTFDFDKALSGGPFGFITGFKILCFLYIFFIFFKSIFCFLN